MEKSIKVNSLMERGKGKEYYSIQMEASRKEYGVKENMYFRVWGINLPQLILKLRFIFLGIEVRYYYFLTVFICLPFRVRVALFHENFTVNVERGFSFLFFFFKILHQNSLLLLQFPLFMSHIESSE